MNGTSIDNTCSSTTTKNHTSDRQQHLDILLRLPSSATVSAFQRRRGLARSPTGQLRASAPLHGPLLRLASPESRPLHTRPPRAAAHPIPLPSLCARLIPIPSTCQCCPSLPAFAASHRRTRLRRAAAPRTTLARSLTRPPCRLQCLRLGRQRCSPCLLFTLTSPRRSEL